MRQKKVNVLLCVLNVLIPVATCRRAGKMLLNPFGKYLFLPYF